MQLLFFSTSLKGIIRKECQSFTNHGHAKTPPTVFNPLSLWLTLPRDMGVSHTQWPSSVTRAILACLWFAQGLHKAQKKSKQQSHSYVPAVCTGLKKIKAAEPFLRARGLHRGCTVGKLLKPVAALVTALTGAMLKQISSALSSSPDITDIRSFFAQETARTPAIQTVRKNARPVPFIYVIIN